MRVAVLGTGMVGRTIGSKLVELGHEVMLGSRSATSEGARAWLDQVGSDRARAGTFAEAAAFGELVFSCTKGDASVDVIRAAGAASFDGKILIDVSNPLDFSRGFPPTLTVCNDGSLGEQLQSELPGARVVKALNTVHCETMVDAARLPGDHDVFVSGNDAGAKQEVSRILREWFGWQNVVDLGDITTARGTEAWLLLWTRLYAAFGNADFNIHLVRKPA